MPELFKLRLQFCTGFETYFDLILLSIVLPHSFIFYSLTSFSFLQIPTLTQKFSFPTNLSGQLFILYCVLCVMLKLKEKSLLHRQRSAEIAWCDRKKKSRIGLVIVWRKCSTEQKWKTELNPHVSFSALEESTAQNYFWQALMSDLHFGHGPLGRAFHHSFKENHLHSGWLISSS